ncbi:hypothetical protein ABFS82_07G109700 [Erythranthe guttata]|nr:PREDICTED: uncharacterized protein LOC105966899 [Erythranthe guttata]|eukprot:XP_012846928.1 PREDICTED: uncharacterized protein LOC105966899 [Erythranthe guttata]
MSTIRCFSATLPSSSSSSYCWSNYQCRARITSCSLRSSAPSVQEEALPSLSQIPPPKQEDKPIIMDSKPRSRSSGIEVPRQKYISVSKSELLDAIVSDMFPDDVESPHQFLSLSRCLDSIIHAEHKIILEQMRADFDLTLSTNKSNTHPRLDNTPSDHFMNNESTIDKEQGHDADADADPDDILTMSSGFTLYLKLLVDFTLKAAKTNPFKSLTNPINTSRVAIPGRFQHAFMKLLHNAGFEELSPRDLMLTSALNTDYLLTLPIYVDWKKASDSNAIIFRRGYASERQKGLLIAEKLDYLQSKLLQDFFFLFAKPLGRLAIWLNEVFKRITQNQEIEILGNRFNLWLNELSLPLKPPSNDEMLYDELKGADILSSDLPIWVAAQKAATLYEGMLSEVGPRERLLRKFLAWVGLVPSTPQHAFDLQSDTSTSESNLSSNFLSRISMSDIWKPASRKSCGNDFRKVLRNAISILFSQSVLQELAFEELILLYTDEIGERETADQGQVSSLQLKIYERIPVPDLPVVFPHKKLSFRILDTVRLDVATIVGLLAYFFSYKFEDILSSPSAALLDVVAASALVLYVSRVLLGYKQTRDRYQLLVNRTLYEKTVASGFGSIHFLLDASEQQQYKEAILVYAILLKAESSQVRSTRAIREQCEAFLYDRFQEKVEMPVDKAIHTLMRLGLLTEKKVSLVDDGDILVQAVPCTTAYLILRDRWNTLLIN